MLLGGADWPPKLRVGRQTGGGLGRLDCVGWKIGGGGGQEQAGNGGREKGWQDGRGGPVVPPGISADGRRHLLVGNK